MVKIECLKVELLRNRYIKEVVNNKKLLGAPIIVYNYVLQWVCSNTPPEHINLNNKLFVFCAISKIADDTMLSVNSVRSAINKLCDDDFKLIEKMYDVKSRRLYLSLVSENVHSIIADVPQNEKIFEYFEEIEVVKAKMKENILFGEANNTKKYSNEAESIVLDLLNANKEVFKTRIPKNLSKVSKTFEKACVKVQDIYTGKILDPKYYNFTLDFLQKNNVLSDWKDKIASVKNDWDKVHDLLLESAENFKLMFDENRFPLKKDYLERNLDKWLFDEYHFGRNETFSQFLICLEEPKRCVDEFMSKKADKLYYELPKTVRLAANELFELCPDNINDVFYWKNIHFLNDWCNWLYQTQINTRYWYDDPADVILQFKSFLEERKINISNKTFDFKESLERNMPFNWFLTEKCKKHGIKTTSFNENIG